MITSAFPFLQVVLRYVITLCKPWLVVAKINRLVIAEYQLSFIVPGTQLSVCVNLDSFVPLNEVGDVRILVPSLISLDHMENRFNSSLPCESFVDHHLNQHLHLSLLHRRERCQNLENDVR